MDKCKEAFTKHFGPRPPEFYVPEHDELTRAQWDRMYSLFSLGWTNCWTSYQENSLKLLEAWNELMQYIKEKDV